MTARTQPRTGRTATSPGVATGGALRRLVPAAIRRPEGYRIQLFAAAKRCRWQAADRHRDWLGRFLKAVADRKRRHHLRAQLYALNDYMLKDIGISRGQIEWIVSSSNRDGRGRVL